jgi:hypothetical protein
VAGPFPAYLGAMTPSSLPNLPETAAPRMGPRPLLAMGVLVALALASSVLLWAHYGTTVFFETIRAGFTACFG